MHAYSGRRNSVALEGSLGGGRCRVLATLSSDERCDVGLALICGAELRPPLRGTWAGTAAGAAFSRGGGTRLLAVLPRLIVGRSDELDACVLRLGLDEGRPESCAGQVSRGTCGSLRTSENVTALSRMGAGCLVRILSSARR